MPARNSSGLLLRSTILSLTPNFNIHIAYGQSNSDGTSSIEYFSNIDTSNGACLVMGLDGGRKRDGTNPWTDLAYPPSAYDFSGLTTSELQEPCRARSREVFFHNVAAILNRRQMMATNQRHFSGFAGFGHTQYPISQLVKGQQAYTNLINGVTKMCALATALGYTPVIRSVMYVQSESDFAASGSGYKTLLGTMQSNLETDLKAITGQSLEIPMFITQQSNFGSSTFGTTPIVYPVSDQLQAHIDYPGKVILAGPMYAAENIAIANYHYYGHQTARWAAGLGNAMATKLIDGLTWEPIRPKTVTRNSNLVDIQFYVPSGPLVLDTNYVTNTPDGFFGFDFHQTGGTTTLQSVTQIGVDTLRFTLSNAPDGTNPFIRAGRNAAGAQVVSGPRTGPRTCLRDSQDSDPRWCNWCVHFDQAIT